jgi:hypothetical protein
MNTTFNISRLGLLLKRYFIENKNRELTFWGIATAIFMLMNQSGSVAMFLYVTGFIFAARSFNVFGYAPGGMHYLLIPATHTEKLVSSILLNTVYFFIMFLISYTIGTIFGITIGNLIFGFNHPLNFSLFQSGEHINQFNKIITNDFSLYDIFFTFAIIQAVFMLGSLYFKRNSIGRTFLTLIAVSIFLGIIELIMFKTTFGTYQLTGQMINFSFPAEENLFSGLNIAGNIVKYAMIPFLWLVSYFRLTEKEV